MEDNATPISNATSGPAPVATPPPPLPPPPPLIVPPASAPPTRRGRGWMVFALILLALFIVSFLFNLGSLASSLFHGGSSYGSRVVGPKLDEVVLEENRASDKIVVIPVRGVISGDAIDSGGRNMVDLIKAQLKRAKEDTEVKAVILKVDSPGGEVLASDDIYRAIAEFQKKEGGKPVIASMGSLAASGGYYISAPCRYIVANEMTITGSIGVIMSSWNYRRLMDKVGVVPETYKSGQFKDMLSGSRDPDKISPEEQKMVQGLIDETFSRFKDVVQQGRTWAFQKNSGTPNKGKALADNWQSFADGRVLSGSEALKRGFVDELGDFDAAVARAKSIAGIADGAKLVEYAQRYELADLLRMFGKTDSKVVKVELGMDLPRLQAGQLYFLSPTFLH
jgi:protease IV